jgi:tetratricopeptide (TPR) repeat protein
MRTLTRLIAVAALAAAALPALAHNDPLYPKLLDIQHQWAHIKYQLPTDDQGDAFSKLETQAAALDKQYPQRAEPKVWEAIVLSTHAGVEGGLGALSKVRKARDLLLAAEKIQPYALEGSIYTSLGSLYYQVPGWPLAFGDDDKAAKYLRKALKANPYGIDANYFYGDFMYRQGDKQAALAALHKALQGPARPDRPLADEGRRHEIQALIAKIQNNG